MSIYGVECVRLNGDIMAYVRVQNDLSGSIRGGLRDIHLDGNGYYCRVDGMRVNVTKQRQQLLDYENKCKTAIDWYNKTKF